MSSHCLAKHRAVRGEEVYNTVRESSVTEDLVDEVVGEDGRVAGLPEGDIALDEELHEYR